MRSISTRAIPFGLLVALTLVAASANADSTRRIVVGGKYSGPTTTSAEMRSLAILHALDTHTLKADLTATTVDRFGDGDAIVRFEQSHRGLPVIGRGATVRMSSRGEPLTSVVDLEDNLPDVAPTVTQSSAATVASSRFAIGATSNDAHLVIWPTLDRGARLAYAVLPRIPAGIPTAPRAIIDAQTGEVLEVRDMVTFAKALTYEFNPVKTPTSATADLLLAPTGTTLSNPFITATNCIDNKTVKPVNFSGFALNVHICDLVQVATANASGDFVYDPSDVAGSIDSKKDAYSEVSIYYHAAKAYAFFRTLQGDPTAQVVVDKPLRLVANLQVPAGIQQGNIQAAANPDTPLETFQNAFFSPAQGGLGQLFQQLYGFNSGALWFGQGPTRDYAYDGDVVYHEFAHAVVDKTLQLSAWHVDAFGSIDSPGAMNEGLADYFSSAITGDPDVGEYAATDLGGGAVIRSLQNDDKCPTGIIGEVHADSTLFSGALWQARQALPEADRAKFDAAIYKSMRSNFGKSDLGYEDLANLFLATLKTDLPSGATQLETAMKSRSILPTCDRVITFEGKPIASPEKRIGFVAPGTQAVSVKGMAPGIIQVKATLPKDTASVDVTFTAKSQSAGAANPLTGGGTPFAPVVLAKFGKAITWDAKSKAGHDATLKGAAASASGSTTVHLDIPEGTTEDSIYLQIASSGETDGAYDSIALSFTAREGVPAEEEPPAVIEPAKQTTTTTQDGCSCNTVGSRSNANWAWVPGIFVGLALFARRKRSS